MDAGRRCTLVLCQQSTLGDTSIIALGSKAGNSKVQVTSISRWEIDLCISGIITERKKNYYSIKTEKSIEATGERVDIVYCDPLTNNCADDCWSLTGN